MYSIPTASDIALADRTIWKELSLCKRRGSWRTDQCKGKTDSLKKIPGNDANIRTGDQHWFNKTKNPLETVFGNTVFESLVEGLNAMT